MWKAIDIGVTVCMLGLALVLWFLAGKYVIPLKAGPVPLGAEESFAEAEGKYLSYEAVYPVESCVEEYYSGDDKRAMKKGYVLYDESRSAFLYVIVKDGYTGEFEGLMRELRYPAKSRRESAMAPVSVEGTLMPMDESMIKRAKKAVESRIGELEGRETDAPVEAWSLLVSTQKDWYMIESETIDGVSKGTIWLCVLAAGCSLFIFACMLIGSLTGEGKQEESMEDGPAGMNQFLTRQSGWVKEWCQNSYNSDKKSAYLWLAGSVAVLVGLGFLAGGTPRGVLTFHLPVGLLFGEAMLGLCWLSMRGKKNWKKVLRKIGDSIREKFPSSEDQEAYFADYFQAGAEWTMEEKCKSSVKRILLGERYWTLLSHYGDANIMDAEKIDHIETCEEILSVRINKVRTYTYSYLAEFVLKDDTKKKELHRYSFESKNTLNSFVQLVKRRTDGRMAVEDLGTRKI